MTNKFLLIVFSLSLFSFSQNDIAFINMEQLFLRMADLQQVDEILQKKKESLIKESEKKYASIKKRKDILEERKEQLSPEKIKGMFETIEYAEKLFKEDLYTSKAKLKKEEDLIYEKLMRMLYSEISKFAVKEKYLLIIDTSKHFGYIEEGTEITETVFKLLKKRKALRQFN